MVIEDPPPAVACPNPHEILWFVEDPPVPEAQPPDAAIRA